MRQVRRPDVDNAAATCERSRLLHDLNRFVAALRPSPGQVIQLNEAADSQGPQGDAKGPGGQRFLHRRPCRRDDDRWPASLLLQGSQPRQPELTRLACPGNALIGQGVRFSVEGYMRRALRRRQKDLKTFHPSLGLLRGSRDHQDRPFNFSRETGDNEGARSLIHFLGGCVMSFEEFLKGWQVL